VHLRIDGNSNVISIILTPGQQHESTVFKDLMDRGAVKRNGKGHPKKRPRRVVGDKAYGSGEIRTFLRKRGIRSTIPRKSNEKRRGSFDREGYRKRNKIERLVGRVKEFRRIATRYEKRAANYLAMWYIGIILLWL
jgi:transposase